MICPTHLEGICPGPAKLRALCSNIDITSGARLPDTGYGISYTISRRQLVDGVVKGCRLCKAILPPLKWGSSLVHLELEQDIQKYLDDVLYDIDDEAMDEELCLGMAYISRADGEWWDVTKLIGWLDRKDGFPPQFVLEMEVAAEESDPAAQFVTERKTNPIVSSDASFEKARSWLGECTTAHADCAIPREVELPTRVLDVSSLESGENPKILATNGQKGRYVALSYCWGGPQPVTSTTKTIAENIRGIDLSSLPQTIKDAILVTRKLGLPYLWIDALCILQDSAEDKSREIGRMAQIYRDSYVAIAAASSTAVADGFLQDRPYLGKPGDWFTIPFYLPNNPDAPEPTGTIHVRSEATYSAVGEPINKRAWTLQEHLLPPRLLIYDSYRLRWECQSHMYADGGSQILLRSVNIGRISKSLRDRALTVLNNTSTNDDLEKKSVLNELLRCWALALHDYMLRQLSFPGDKFPAVSAIAHDYAELTGDTYIAGLWKSSLVSSLMWHCQVYGRRHTRPSRPATYRAPTWSWASVENREIFITQQVLKGDIEVLNYSAQPSSELAPFGEVKEGASITIRGLCRNVMVRKWPDTGYAEMWNVDEVTSPERQTPGIKLGQIEPDIPGELTRIEEGGYEILCCLAVVPASINESCEAIEGVVLRLVDDESKTFSRVGAFRAHKVVDWLIGSTRQDVTII
ncbi:hypothetical protein ONZ45_g9000 [Pleurotus djamor]|nr:hypothetical protein ONZ45_g9000 [Pleurotus djamor]